ncbi:MAG: 5-deoxy-glucuronate isomerase [Acidimicrobiia bacterium]|nr:MAG: 5-deoxy-glucuronate isomerase [Acidimicrobiia bacterium]
MTKRFYPAGSNSRDSVPAVEITAAKAEWRYSGLRVLNLVPGTTLEFPTETTEMAILPLSGGVTVEVDSHVFHLAGRENVFSSVTDFAYVPIDASVLLKTQGPLEVALCTAEATRRIDPYRVDAADVHVEVRGGGSGTRQINNFLSADVADADKLIAVEVLTPEGGWSSYPPHKHDETTETEIELEEIYYFRIEGDDGFGFFRCFTDDGEIDDTLTVRDGDVYLVPRGYHGPAAAAPLHHMYYLNVMAGPSSKRVWRFCDDPRLGWVRDVLDALPADPRLPLTSASPVLDSPQSSEEPGRQGI